MPGPLVTTTTIPAAVTSYFDKLLLVRALPKLLHAKVAQRRPLPGRSSLTIVFRRMSALPLATTPLVEGVPPTGNTLAKTDVTVTVRQWGAYTALSDLVEVTTDHPILQDTTKLLGEQSGQTLDALMRDAFAVGTSVFYGGGVANRASLVGPAQIIDATVLQKVIRELQSNNASMYTKEITATDKVDTHPIRPAYWAITSPEVAYDLENIPDFIPATNYSNTGPAIDGEVGSYRNLRFLVSTQAKKYLAGGGAVLAGVQSSDSTNADVHTILVFAQDAVATVPLSAMSFENIIKPRGSIGSDPLNQYGTMGWKRTGAELILNDDFMTRIEVTVSS